MTISVIFAISPRSNVWIPRLKFWISSKLRHESFSMAPSVGRFYKSEIVRKFVNRKKRILLNWITYVAWRSNRKPHAYTDILTRMWNSDKKSAHFSQIGSLSSITFLKSCATTLRRYEMEKEGTVSKHIHSHPYSRVSSIQLEYMFVPFYVFWGAVSYLAVVCANDSFLFKTFIGKYIQYVRRVPSDGYTFTIHSCLL